MLPDLTGALRGGRIRSTGAGGDGVEVASKVPEGIVVRDSKDPDGPVSMFTREERVAFVGGAEDGEFDR